MTKVAERMALALAADFAFITIADPPFWVCAAFGFAMGAWVGCAGGDK